MRKFGYILGDDRNGVLVLRENRVLIPLNLHNINKNKFTYGRQCSGCLIFYLKEEALASCVMK